MAVLTRQPNVVLTARGDKPRVEKTLVKELMSCILGRSSATTIQVLTLDRFTPLCYNSVTLSVKQNVGLYNLSRNETHISSECFVTLCLIVYGINRKLSLC